MLDPTLFDSFARALELLNSQHSLEITSVCQGLLVELDCSHKSLSSILSKVVIAKKITHKHNVVQVAHLSLIKRSKTRPRVTASMRRRFSALSFTFVCVTQRAIPTRVHTRTGLLVAIYTNENQFSQTGQFWQMESASSVNEEILFCWIRLFTTTTFCNDDFFKRTKTIVRCCMDIVVAEMPTSGEDFRTLS